VVLDVGLGQDGPKFTGMDTTHPDIFKSGYSWAHMENATKPAGGNILYQDCHVAWRRFGEMKKQSLWRSGQYWYW
jgi:prepilin-type processing-associated H-X9-DG protein